MNTKLRAEANSDFGKDFFRACVCYFLPFSPNDSPSKSMKNAFYFI